jgi:uncharacterized protein (TIGR03437 family)
VLRNRFLLLALFASASAFAQTNTNVAIYNGARFELVFPVSPNCYTKINGTFAGAGTAVAATVPLPTELGNTRVLVGEANTPAPLYAVSNQEISFLMPTSTPAGRASVRVLVGGTEVARGTATVVPVSPGIFFVVGDALKQGGILNQSSQYAVEAAPARRGEVIQIFGTGQGPVDQTVAEGAVPTRGVLARTTNPVKAIIAGVEADVTFSGLSPDFPGLWQINVVVPNQAFITGRTELFLTIGGVSSNPVSFWVAQ